MAFGDIAKLLASLDLDTRAFEKGAGRVSGDLSKMEGGMGRVGVRAQALGTAVGVGLERLAEKGINVLFGAIQSGEEQLHVLQDAQAQTSAVIASTGGKAGISAKQVRDLAESIENLTTADDKSVQNAENLLLTFTGIGKKAFPDATKAVVNLGIAMNKGSADNLDLSKSAIQVGKALNDPIKGVTALSRVGVSFSAQQIKRIKKLQEEGDLYGAQKVILQELQKEFGKAGEAAGTSGAAGVRRLNDAVEDAQVSLATGLEPALNNIRGQIATTLADPKTQTALRDLGKFLGEAAEKGLDFAKSIPWDKVADGLKAAAGFAGNLISAFTNLPPGVQATIIGLAGLNKLAGGGVIKVGVDLFKGGAEKIFGSFFQRGSSPANPMFVTGGIGGGVGGAGAAATGGLGAASKLFLVGEAIGLIAAVNEVRDGIAAKLTEQTGTIHDAVSNQINSGNTNSGQLYQSLQGVEQGIAELQKDPIGNALLGDQLSKLEQMRTELSTALVKQDAHTQAAFRDSERDDASHTAVTKQAIDRSRDATEATRIKLSTELGLTRQNQERTMQWAASRITQVEDRRGQQITAKVGDLQRTQTSSASRIVTAIQRNRPIVNVKVNVAHGDTIRVTKNYQSGQNLRTGGQQEFG